MSLNFSVSTRLFPSEWKYHTFFFINNSNNKNPLALIYLLTFKARVSQVAQGWTIHLPMQETQQTQVRSLGQENPLEEEMATYYSTLAREIPQTEKPGGLQFTGLQRVGHDWSNGAYTHACDYIWTHSDNPGYLFVGQGGRAVLFSVRCFHLIAYSASTPKIPWTWPPSNVNQMSPGGQLSPIEKHWPEAKVKRHSVSGLPLWRSG